MDSTIKTTTYTLNWTIRFIRTPGFWVGLDLGVEGTTVDLNAVATNYLAGKSEPAAFKSTLPMPQIGPALGYRTENGRLVVRGYYHYLGYKGATYSHAGGDLRFFPLKWLGVRAFTSSETWKVPNNSLASDLEIGLDRSGSGFGVVLNF